MPSKLVIVESPTKAKTIGKFLGAGYKVLSSFGHIRDLPTSKIGVDTKHDYEPTYVVPPKSKPAETALLNAAKNADDIYLATDEDREGEAIAWHIAELLGLDPVKAKRITFHEITKAAIDAAIAKPRSINLDLVNAQQARRILDRLVGYELSPLLWKMVQRGLSAGRVQSVALRLIVDRERERQAFNIQSYWSVDGMFKKGNDAFEASLNAISGKKLEKLELDNEARVNEIVSSLSGAAFSVSSVEKKRVMKKAPVPFTTSAIQIEANAKLGYSAKQTMRLAQILYETGRITYMRTDSMNLSEQFIASAQAYATAQLGPTYVTGGRHYKTEKKGAQEAHEAIRPTDINVTPDSLKSELDPQVAKMYELIWRRTLASQLPDAELERTAADLTAKEYTFRANGNSVVFDGYMKIYRASKEEILPVLVQGDSVVCESLTPTKHETQPPARFSDATLVKVMEEHGIGRPSTYAPTIGTIESRNYVERDEQKKLKPTQVGMVVTDFLAKQFPDIVDYEFTSKLEAQLDDIAEQGHAWIPIIDGFYKPFHKKIESTGKMDRSDVRQDKVLGVDPATGENIYLKLGQYGSYIQRGEPSKDKEKKPKTISIPRSIDVTNLTMDQAQQILSVPKALGTLSDGSVITLEIGRFGPYLKAGLTNSSIDPTIDPFTITPEQSILLVEQGREQKRLAAIPIATFTDPATQKTILVKTGRFGPYVTDGEINASVSKKFDPAALTLEQALDLLEKKRIRGPGRFGKKAVEKKEEKPVMKKKSRAAKKPIAE